MTSTTIDASTDRALPAIPRMAMQSVAGGLALMAFFTCMWGSWAIPGLRPVIGIAVAVLFAVFAIAFLVEAIRLLWASRAFPARVLNADPNKDTGPDDRARSGRRFRAIFGAEGAVIFIACAILGATDNSDFINPAIALIVGLHFIPLARVFGRTLDYYVAAWFVLAGLAGFAAIVTAAMPVALVWSLVAIAAACGTSFYGFYMVGVKRAMLATR